MDHAGNKPCCGGVQRVVTGAVKLASSAVPGDHIASEATIRQRRLECGKCEHALKLQVAQGVWMPVQCKLCGCIIPAKTRLKAERCPADPPKWTEEKTA